MLLYIYICHILLQESTSNWSAKFYPRVLVWMSAGNVLRDIQLWVVVLTDSTPFVFLHRLLYTDAYFLFYWHCPIFFIFEILTLDFIFYIQVADASTLYGCCVLVEEMIQKPSGLISTISDGQPICSGLSRYILTTRRCYCILSRLPFFELHFGVLNRSVNSVYKCIFLVKYVPIIQ